MTEFLIKIIPSIAGIDGGCSSCITIFLGKIYMEHKFDLEKILDLINEYNKDKCGGKISIADVFEYVNYKEWENKIDDL